MKKILILLLTVIATWGCSEEDTNNTLIPTDAISLSTQQLAFNAAGEVINGTESVIITSSDSWRLTGKKVWCKPSETEGKQGAEITFTIEPNSTSETRSEIYKFICGQEVALLEITQLPGNILEIATNELTLNADAEFLSLKVNANSNFSYEIKYDNESVNKDWITPVLTRGLPTSYLYFNVQKNSSMVLRQATITIVSESGEKKVCTVIQQQNNSIQCEKSIYALQAEGGQIDVKVKANIPYISLIPRSCESWIIPIENETGRAVTEQTHRFSVAPARFNRTGEILFCSEDGTIVDTVTITQEGLGAIYTNIPDQNFRNLLIGWKYVKLVEGTKCELTEAGIDIAWMSTGSSWSYTGYNSLEGIEAFTALTSLSCCKNNLTRLDISALTQLVNIDFGYNPFNEIILGDIPVELIDLSWNKLRNERTYVSSTNLKISGTKVKNIQLSNNQLQILDVSECPNLVRLDCSQNSNLTALYLKMGQTIPNLLRDAHTTIIYK